MGKPISLDEFLHSPGFGGLERKHFARDNGVIIKGIRLPSGQKSGTFNEDSHSMRFIMSAEVEDRDRDIVVQEGLDTAEFEKNPVAPWSHRASDPPIGMWQDLSKSLTGRPKRTEGTCVLTIEDPRAKIIEAHWKAGSLRACSIGFMPKDIERREVPDDKKDDQYYYYPGYMIHSAELYECSPCTVPANPAALAKAAASGDLHAREVIEHVLDNWTMKDGVLMDRKSLEEAHTAGSNGKTFVVVEGVRYLSESSEKGVLTLTPAPSEAEKLHDELSKNKGLLAKFAGMLGIKLPSEEGEQKAAEPPAADPQQEAKDSLRKDLPALERKHKILEADAKLAAAEAKYGVTAPN